MFAEVRGDYESEWAVMTKVAQLLAPCPPQAPAGTWIGRLQSEISRHPSPVLPDHR